MSDEVTHQLFIWIVYKAAYQEALVYKIDDYILSVESLIYYPSSLNCYLFALLLLIVRSSNIVCGQSFHQRPFQRGLNVHQSTELDWTSPSAAPKGAPLRF
jgi:hypothetical protein